MKLAPLKIDLGPVAMTCTADEIGSTLGSLLDEMRAVIPKLRGDERAVLRRIMSRDEAPTVGELFPDFHRESEAHKTLRRLRAAQFIRPAVHGRWDPDEPIQVKPFARLMWDHLGEAEIFSDGTDVVEGPAEPAEPEVDPEDVILNPVEDDDEVIDLAEEPAEPAKPAGEWNEEAILEYLRDSPEDERA